MKKTPTNLEIQNKQSIIDAVNSYIDEQLPIIAKMSDNEKMTVFEQLEVETKKINWKYLKLRDDLATSKKITIVRDTTSHSSHSSPKVKTSKKRISKKLSPHEQIIQNGMKVLGCNREEAIKNFFPKGLPSQ